MLAIAAAVVCHVSCCTSSGHCYYSASSLQLWLAWSSTIACIYYSWLCGMGYLSAGEGCIVWTTTCRCMACCHTAGGEDCDCSTTACALVYTSFYVVVDGVCVCVC